MFTRLVGSNGSLSESDKAIVLWFVDNQREGIPLFLPPTIPQKENLTFLVGSLLKHEIPTYLIPYLKTATDVLRVAVVMSGGDVSLATPGKFRRFKRTERRFLLDAMEAIPAVTEDMLRRPEVWKRLGRELRPGDYASRYPKTLKAFDVIRNNEAFETFNGKVEAGLIRQDVATVTDLLKTRPGDFARRFDHLLRTSGEQTDVALKGFMDVAHKVSTPVLLQVHAHFKNRDRVTDHRAFFPKGSVAKVQVIDETLPPLPTLKLAGEEDLDKYIARFVRDTLVKRFKSLPSLGKVYVDEALRTQNVPFAQRSASKTLRTISSWFQAALCRPATPSGSSSGGWSRKASVPTSTWPPCFSATTGSGWLTWPTTTSRNGVPRTVGYYLGPEWCGGVHRHAHADPPGEGRAGTSRWSSTATRSRRSKTCRSASPGGWLGSRSSPARFSRAGRSRTRSTSLAIPR